MDKALKQRLVGAIVLIILAVIVLPMLLSGRSETLKQESRQIEVPPKPDELSIETRRFPVGIPNHPDAAATEAAADAATGTAEQTAELAVERSGPNKQIPAGSAPGAEPGVETPGPERRVESPLPVTTIKLPGATNAPVVAPLPDTGESEVPRYLVQVASFSSEKRANALAQRLRGQDLAVLMDVVDRTAGRMHRVRVGPYIRREDASAVVAALRDDPDPDLSGLAPRVLDLRPDESAPVTTPSDPLVRWVVQVGSFSEAARADALVNMLREAGLTAFSEQVTAASGVAYKVRIGPEISRDRAVELQRKVKQEHGLDGFVTTSE